MVQDSKLQNSEDQAFGSIFINVAIFVITPVLFLIILVGIGFLSDSREPRVEQVSEDVEVTATVGACILELTVKPEKRIPPVGNDQTELTVDIYDNSNTLVGTVTGNSNNVGVATMDICDQGLALTPGTYNFKVRGLSHLRKDFGDYFAFSLAVTQLDLSNGGTEQLLAGETSVIYDNYINSLDISTQINALYTSDNKNDLNQDSTVNSLDISNTIYNFYLAGE